MSNSKSGEQIKKINVKNVGVAVTRSKLKVGMISKAEH